jgi:hypothetical protein
LRHWIGQIIQNYVLRQAEHKVCEDCNPKGSSKWRNAEGVGTKGSLPCYFWEEDCALPQGNLGEGIQLRHILRSDPIH